MSKISKLSRVFRRTISKGVPDGQAQPLPNRIRKAGGGRKKLTEHQPEMLAKIESLVVPHTMGNPTNPLVWTSKSVRKTTDELVAFTFKASHTVVRTGLKEWGFRLQSNKKTEEGDKAEDRNEQFEYINAVAVSFMEQGNPVISVDCKKKELIDPFKNNGQEWQVKKDPIPVNVSGFVAEELGKAVPYGAYGLADN